MSTRALALALACSSLLVVAPAAAQSRAPRSPTEQAVSLRQGSPDLALDSRMAGTPTSSGGEVVSDPWTDGRSGAVLVGLGAAVLVGSGVAAGVAIDAASTPPDPATGDGDGGRAAFFGVTSGIAGALGLALVIPGIVLIAGDDGRPAATAHVAPTGASLDVRF